MKKAVSIYLCLFLIVFPSVGFSQEDPTPEPKKITVELLDKNLIKWENTKYILVDENTATLLFERYNKYPDLELSRDKLAELTNLYLEQLRLNTEINTNLNEQNNLLMEENAGLKKIIDRGDPWYESWWFLMGLGFVCGTGLTIGIMKIVKEI